MKSIPLMRLVKYQALLMIQGDFPTVAALADEGDKIRIYALNGDGTTLALCAPDDAIFMFTEAKHNTPPVYTLGSDKNLRLTVVKTIDVGEYLQTGEYPTLPSDKVMRLVDSIKITSTAVGAPYVGVVSHAMLGNYLLGSEPAKPVFAENNDVIVGRDIARKRVLSTATDKLWENEGYVMAKILGVTDSKL